jgi:molybdopterin synthase catalytic subunit
MTIKLFGMLKDLAGGREEVVWDAGHNGHSVRDLARELTDQFPHLGELIQDKKVLISVNHEIATDETSIQTGDEVALLPPFAGGADTLSVAEDASVLVRVQRENFSVDQEIDRVRNSSKMIGGINVFLGTARERSQGREVSRITFEYYEGMAQKTLRQIRERALTQFDILEVLIIHRYGDIDIGENIVLIVVGAEHRADAFKACRWCIDELKQITPIWKCETTPAGEVWVEQHP